MTAEEAGNLGLHGMRQQRSRAVAQNLGQWVRKRPWLRQLDDIILGHGVSLLQWRSGGVKHPHDTPPYSRRHGVLLCRARQSPFVESDLQRMHPANFPA